MTKNIDQIIQELLAIDPSFTTHEKSLRKLITELLKSKPDTRLDEQFVARLRERLLEEKPIPSPFMKFSYLPYVLGVLAVLIVVPLGYKMTQDTGTSGSAVFAMNQQIEHISSNAYGTLASQEGGRDSFSSQSAATEKGAPTMATMAASDAVAPVAANPPETAKISANMAYGMGGGAASDMRMMVPNGPITVTSYVYKGDALDLAADGDVYSRVKNSVSSGQIATQLKKFNFGLLNLNGFAEMQVRSFELAENKPYGYSISANFDEGMISINANYLQWPGMNGKEIQQTPMSAMPKESDVIAIAKKFLDDHDISLDNFADPVVQEYGNIAASEMQFAPEQVTVTYPLKISGTPVYEDGAYPYGLQVGVSVKDKKVMSVYGLTSQTYSSSGYKLETSSDKILSVLSKGGPHAWIPQESDGITIKKVEVEVGTPTKVLMHTYNYKDGNSQELFVPALSFPVTSAPIGDGQYYPKQIVIPLVPDLLNDSGGPVIYDMMR